MPSHTDKQYEQELNRLRDIILQMGANVEGMINQAMASLFKRDAQIADHVIESDDKIDEAQKMIDEISVNLLALHQPAASDLRFITSGLRISNDLERMGDLAVNIAQKAKKISVISNTTGQVDQLKQTAQCVRDMVQNAIDAFVKKDVALAQQVLAAEDEVDRRNWDIHEELVAEMQEQPQSIPSLIFLLLISRHLERLADHATNVAELVIFLVKGEDIRHQAG